jgi:hypothetical protein
MDPLLELVPADERPVVTAAAGEIRAATQAWAASRLGASGPGLCARLAATVAAIAPSLPADRLALLTRYALWTFLLDDSLDDPSRTVADIQRTSASVGQVLDGSAPAGPVAEVLAELLPHIARFDRGGRIPGAIRDDVAAGATHATLSRRVASGEEAAPCAEDYLALASRSIGYRTVGLLLLLLLGHRTAAAGEPLTWAGRAVRLANDVRSAARHRAEGTLDVLSLRTRASVPVTRELALRWIAEAVDAHDRLAAVLPGTGPALVRSLRISVGMYGVTQLRDQLERQP